MGNLLQGIGMAKPVSEWTNMAMQLRRNEDLGAIAQQEARIRKGQADEMQRQQEHLDTVVDFRMSPFFLSLPDTAKEKALETFKGMGAFDDNYRGTRRQMYSALGEIEKNKDAYNLLMAPVIQAKADAVVKAFEKSRKTPDDTKAKAEYESARMSYEAANGKLLEHLGNLDKVTTVTTPAGAKTTVLRGGVPAETIEGPPKEVDPTKQEMVDLRRDMFEETKRSNRALEAMKKEKQGGTLTFAEKNIYEI